QVPVKAFVSLSNELAVNRFSLLPDLSPQARSMAFLFGSQAKATRQTPSAASNLNSFIFAWRDPLRVSARGRPSCGPNCSSNPAWANISSCTCSGKASNSASNSSCKGLPTSLIEYVLETIWRQVHNRVHSDQRRFLRRISGSLDLLEECCT